MSLSVHIVDMRHVQDNYNYVLRDEEAGVTTVIDPSEAEGIARFLDAQGWTLDRILVTHSHWDHVGGIKKLVSRYDCSVTANADDPHTIPCVTHPIRPGARVRVGGHVAQVIDAPGHLRGHVLYYFEEDALLFAGDMLFRMGCGRIFEGTPQEYFATLQTIAALPDDVTFYAAHEYTLSNARFAASVDPDNPAIAEQTAQAQALADAGKPTVQSTIGWEKAANPFLRAKSAEAFAALRAAKDRF